jgi:hypothetical protein
MWDFDFMRPEIWHALSVHFPIALLLVSTLTLLISFFLKNGKGEALAKHCEWIIIRRLPHSMDLCLHRKPGGWDRCKENL